MAHSASASGVQGRASLDRPIVPTVANLVGHDVGQAVSADVDEVDFVTPRRHGHALCVAAPIDPKDARWQFRPRE